MKDILFNILIGALPESLFFSLFLIYTKKITSKRVLFCSLMFIEYAILMNVVQYNIWFQIVYTFMTFLILKVLYKEKAIITDIFAFAVASLILVVVSVVSYLLILNTINVYMIAWALNRVLLFGTLFLLRNKLNKLYMKFNSIWNRKQGQKVRSLTVRNISVIVFNLMFYVINFCLMYALTHLN